MRETLLYELSVRSIKYYMLMPLWSVTEYDGEPRGKEGQQLAWVKAEALSSYEMPPADVPLVAPVQRAIRRLASRPTTAHVVHPIHGRVLINSNPNTTRTQLIEYTASILETMPQAPPRATLVAHLTTDSDYFNTWAAELPLWFSGGDASYMIDVPLE